jgi:hypothetical protein
MERGAVAPMDSGPMMKRGRMKIRALLVLAVISSAGCAGPRALAITRQKYNESIQKTTNEQFLLNLVRLRYRDPTAFIELSSLSTQFASAQSLFANGQLDEKSINSSIFKFGGALATEQRPTVTYDPLQGQAFVRRLVAPMSVDTLILLVRSGWRTDRVLRMMV